MVSVLSLLVGCSNKSLLTTISNITDVSTTEKEPLFVFKSFGDGTCAVFDCQDIESLVVPERSPEGDLVTYISGMQNKKNLKYVTLPSSIKELRMECFLNSSIVSITMPFGLELIESRAFYGCDKLRSIEIPGSVKSIESCSFEKCKSLKTLVFNEGVEQTGNLSFADCLSLESITFPRTLKRIESSFYNCPSLSSIEIPGSVECVDEFAFSYCSVVTQLTIEDGVEKIGEGAFMDFHLNKVFIPKSITEMGRGIFGKESKGITIYCAAESKPEGWDDDWNRYHYNVIWGATREDSI